MKTHLGFDQTGPKFSFSQLLELPPTQAAEILHLPENLAPPATGVWGNYPPLRTHCRDVKHEPLDLGSNSSFFDPTVTRSGQKLTKRKEREKGKESKKKKNKTSGEGDIDEKAKLPYVHVRAPRGQATNRHSLAERARREKINARMKLLEELVPGCNNISGTALMLDEIINHVQSLQRQVEFLSMRLATVNPTIDIDIDNLLAAQAGSSMDSNLNMFMPLMCPDGQASMTRDQYSQLCHFSGLHFPTGEKEEKPNFITPENSLPSYVSSINSASLLTSQIEKET